MEMKESNSSRHTPYFLSLYCAWTLYHFNLFTSETYTWSETCGNIWQKVVIHGEFNPNAAGG